MTPEFALTNARVVAPDAVFEGSVSIADGLIAGVDTSPSRRPSAIDLEGDFLIPGLVELHTDNLEQHLVPRPDVIWPSGLAAVIAYDTGIAGAGITTVFDSLTVGDYSSNGMRKLMIADAMAAIHQAVATGLLRSEHHLHLRCEVADPAMAEMLTQYVDDPMLRLASIMDHTPGQRQWRDIEAFRTFYRDKKWTDAEMYAEIESRQALHASHSADNFRLALDLCRGRGIAMASHDDTTPEHVDEAVANGLTICEFPTTEAAARRARDLGMAIMMGAPNAVRGGSHAGNVIDRRPGEKRPGRRDVIGLCAQEPAARGVAVA